MPRMQRFGVRFQERWEFKYTWWVKFQIVHRMGTLKPATPLELFDKCRLIPAPGFTFTLPNLSFTAHTIYHNTELAYTPVIQPVQLVKMGYTLASIRNKAGPKCFTCCKGSPLETHIHTHSGSILCS